MANPFSKTARVFYSSRGISLGSIILIAAVLVAALHAYAFFNPDFELGRYSLVYFLRSYNDSQKLEDLENIQGAVERYYDEHGEYPANNEWCGRIVSVLRPEAKDAIARYFENEGVPQDPSYRGTNKDYFYRREDRHTYVLMAVLENPPAGSPTYNYEKCHDWPGDDVYNYRLVGSR